MERDATLQEWERFSAEDLIAYVNQLIIDDFADLVNILYRLDVSEDKLKILLADNPLQDAGKLIAALIIERQQQKLASRKRFGQDDYIADEDRW